MRLKKRITILLSFIYLCMTTGMSINFHYCHGQIECISFFEKDHGCCCKKGIHSSKCCFDENYKYEIKSDQIISKLVRFDFQISLLALTNPFPSLRTYLSEIYSKQQVWHPPSNYLTKEIPLRILQSIFRL